MLYVLGELPQLCATDTELEDHLNYVLLNVSVIVVVVCAHAQLVYMSCPTWRALLLTTELRSSTLSRPNAISTSGDSTTSM